MLFINFCEPVGSEAVGFIDKWFVNRTGGCEAA